MYKRPPLHLSRHKAMIYIYVDKEEYAINLTELDNRYIDETSCEFKVDGDFVYFKVASSYWCAWNIDEYVINYKHKTYVCTSKNDDERNKKVEDNE